MLADGPVSYWTLNETTGGGACDVRGRNHAKIRGGVSSGQGNAVAGTAMSFDGSSGYLELGGATSLQPTGALSVEGWIKTRAMGFQTVLRSRLSGYDLYLQEGLPTAFACGQANPCAESIGESFAYKLQGSSSVADDRWHHLVLTKDAATAKLYVDGVMVASRAHSEPVFYAGTGIAIGRDGDGDYAYAAGSLDEVAVYDHALGAPRVQAHFAAGPTVPSPASRGGHNPSAPNLACSQNEVAEPVNTGTGNFWHTFEDVSVPGRGSGLPGPHLQLQRQGDRQPLRPRLVLHLHHEGGHRRVGDGESHPGERQRGQLLAYGHRRLFGARLGHRHAGQERRRHLDLHPPGPGDLHLLLQWLACLGPRPQRLRDHRGHQRRGPAHHRDRPGGAGAGFHLRDQREGRARL